MIPRVSGAATKPVVAQRGSPSLPFPIHGPHSQARNWRLVLSAQAGKVALRTTRSRSACCAASSWRDRIIAKKKDSIYLPGKRSVRPLGGFTGRTAEYAEAKTAYIGVCG